MKALVTGGAGVIGSHLVDELIERDYKVVVIDNLSRGKIDNIKHNIDKPNFKFINDTILNEDLMRDLIKDVNIVFHLAAVVGVKHIIDDPLQGIVTNVKGTENVLKFSFRYWKRVIFASTSEIYGKSQKIPFKEDGERVLGSTRVVRWSYSTAKALDEHLAFSYFQKGLPVTIVRYFNSYGPRLDENGYGSVIARFIVQSLKNEQITVHGDGNQTRCFTYISDTVNGTLLAAEKEEAIGEVFNVGNIEETSILNLAKTIKEMTNSNSEIIFVPYEDYFGAGYEETMRRLPDINKIKTMLGFVPMVGLKEGLAKTIEWAKENYKDIKLSPRIQKEKVYGISGTN